MSVFRTSNNVTGTSTTSDRTPTTTDRNGAGTERKVPAQRVPYQTNGPTEESFPDGPTERLDKEAKASRKRGRGAVLLALLALGASAVAAAMAWQALTVARSATPARSALAGPTTSAAAAGTGYAVAYAQEPLRVQVGCSAVLFVDLDEPRRTPTSRSATCGTTAAAARRRRA